MFSKCLTNENLYVNNNIPISPVLNPILYSLIGRRFRHNLRNALPGRRDKTPQTTIFSNTLATDKACAVIVGQQQEILIRHSV